MAEHAVIGYCRSPYVCGEFSESLLATAMEGPTPLDAVIAVPSGPNISHARNNVVRRFLEQQRAPWLLMVDTDMVFAPDALHRLILAADPVERPVAGALCYSQDEAGSGEHRPTMYELIERDGKPGFARYRTWPEDECFRVGATGAAFLLMHRRVLEKISAAGKDPVAPWFRESVLGGLLCGEDMTFCLRAAMAGVPVHVHTGVQVGHVKPVMLGKVT
jgi:GT2 family glycosyltransferase